MTRSLKKFDIFKASLINKIIFKKFSLFEDLSEKMKLKNKIRKRVEGKIFISLNYKEIKIFPYMVGLNFLVYNGRDYFFIVIKDHMVNYKLGEFLTTKLLGFEIHLEKKKRKIKNN